MDRRSFLLAAGTMAAFPGLAAARSSVSASPEGAVDASLFGVSGDGLIDQSAALQSALNSAALENKPVFLPPGRYVVSGIALPGQTRLVGVPGASRLVFGGGDYMFRADGGAFVQLADLIIDGAGLPLADHVSGMIHLANVDEVIVSGCRLAASGGSALALRRCGGRLTGNLVEGAAKAGMFLVESTGLSVTDNTVTGCGDGGILVYRWQAGEDGTIVSGNRIEKIAARSGGTGQNGNGINVFRADNVVVANNRVADCAFSAIRANSADNVQITGNNCSRLGEVAIYSEFSFQGAVIANNLVDGAATGISITNFREGGRMATVSGNLLRNLHDGSPQNPASAGTGIAVEADATVSGNVVDVAGTYGLMLGWGPYLRDIAATGNVIRQAPVGIAVSVVEGSGTAVVTDNLISGASEGGIVGMRWDKRGPDDLTRPDAERFPHLLIERNRIS